MTNIMESYLFSGHFDLVTPDGAITEIIERREGIVEALVQIDGISPAFVGFQIDQEHVSFNGKSTLAQLGFNEIGKEIELDRKTRSARILVELVGIGPIAKALLPHIDVGAYIGKLFAADPRRRVRNADYLLRMFGRTDRDGDPLLSLGGSTGGKSLHLEKANGFTVAHLQLKDGVIEYRKSVEDFLPTLAKALSKLDIQTRKLLRLHQEWIVGKKRCVEEENILLIKTMPLHIRTAFGRVVEEQLPSGLHHTTANVLEPNTRASGDIYEIFGEPGQEITHIPLEFYTLEPHREHVFFTDRDQLQSSLDSPDKVFQAFNTAPKAEDLRSAVFIVKGEQMQNLSEEDWVSRKVHPEQFPGLFDLKQQSHSVEEYIKQQPSYPFLKAIEEGLITSQGVLFSRYFPTPLMKKMLLGDLVQSSLKQIYFSKPSQSHGDFFSHEDRTALLDLAKFAILVFWADQTTGKLLQFVPKGEKDTGMFVPLSDVQTFAEATTFGVYGSNLLDPLYESEVTHILEGVLEMRKTSRHPLINKNIPLALITGGGPGVMEMGNRVARRVRILSCANIVDFGKADLAEQTQNPYIDAKMTFRLDRLFERQAEFNLDFPIFLEGGIGTDFEFALETVRRKVGIGQATPILLFGPKDYWQAKITPQFQANLKKGTISGSEWVSNSFYCVQTGTQGLRVYKEFLSGNLPIGADGPISDEGFFCIN